MEIAKSLSHQILLYNDLIFPMDLLQVINLKTYTPSFILDKNLCICAVGGCIKTHNKSAT